MNIGQIENNIKTLVEKLLSGSLATDDFIYELLLAYGHRNSTVSMLKSGQYNIASEPEEIIFKRHLFFKSMQSNELHAEIDRMKNQKLVAINRLRFVIVTNFENLLAIDTKTGDSLDIPIADLPRKFDFFLPWADMEKAVYQGENPADVKAAEKMAKLFDLIKADNFPEETLDHQVELHNLNVFLTRLLFCFFAEDTEIFADNQFSNAIQAHTNEDGSDLSDYLNRLFIVLNTSDSKRDILPEYLANFPYVNGGLFADDIPSPNFSRKSRRMLIECGSELNWSDINPDIFGSMIQAVVHPNQRGGMGMHYTSVTNIMKVIDPLFLSDFYEELDKSSNSIVKLQKFQQRLGEIKIFDPACGSGNFLIIAYKELRKLEMEILKRWQKLELIKTGQLIQPYSTIKLSQFFGIELDDFAHEVAILSLWLAEHQMNIEFKIEFGKSTPSLPLLKSGNIVCGNANRMDWKRFCDNTKSEVYVIGNPPYRGFNKQDKEQKTDMAMVFPDSMLYGKLDYVCCWIYKASMYCRGMDTSTAFVTTSSISQGEQVELIWPEVLSIGIEIRFAHRPFFWQNSAKDNASVMCVVIGFGNESIEKSKKIFENDIERKVKKINAYLTAADDIYVKSSNAPISKRPVMTMGSNAIDGTHLLLTGHEYIKVTDSCPGALKYIRRYMGGADFLNGKVRYCIWVDESNYHEASQCNLLMEKFEACRLYRLSAGRDAKKVADKPYRFCYRTHKEMPAIIVPQTTTDRRTYLPIGITSANTVVSAKAFAIYQVEMFYFGLLSSKMHHIWMATTSGKPAGGGYAYSVKLTYNTFPIPMVNEVQKREIENLSLDILAIREAYNNKSLAELYEIDKMPNDLIDAHEKLDFCVDSIYSKNIFGTDEDRLEVLFNLYEKLTEGQNA
jgi:hypothetical protein